jgi:hypothetical protein
MKKFLSFCLFFFLSSLVVFCQLQVNNSRINPDIISDFWPASWITCPEVSIKDYGVYHFRKTFTLNDVPEEFIIHVSADNRYSLYVNGNFITYGPSRGDLQHWRFESLDISRELREGTNVIAAVVWNFGEYIPFSQITNKTAFIVAGNSPLEAMVNTNDSWKVVKNEAYKPLTGFGELLNTFTVVGPGDLVRGDNYPWGWERPGFDDGLWLVPRMYSNGTPRGKGTDGAWMLVPREIDLMYVGMEPFHSVKRSEGIDVPIEALNNGQDIHINAGESVSFLLDQGFLTKSFPRVVVSGGKDSEIKISYAEALFDKEGEKGNRNEILGKSLKGYYDIFIPDGGQARSFMPLWFRTYRYVLVNIKTNEEPLVIHRILSSPTGFPLKERSSFKSSDPILRQVWDIGFRTARLCAAEIYYDCPYYEQMQYVGDTRIQALISLYVDGNDKLMRKAIRIFDDSRLPNGLTQSRYPSSAQQIIPPYSLFWIAMIHDYWMYRDDPDFVRSFLPGIRGVLEWFEDRIDENDMLGPLEWWNFVDWAFEWPWDNTKRIGGVPYGVAEGNSSNLTLQYAYALDLAAEIFHYYGNEHTSRKYKEISQRIKNAIFKHCWDENKGLLSENPEKNIFSQHANIFGILTAAIPEEKQVKVMRSVLEDTSIIQCTMYFRFYLFQALKKSGLADLYLENLDQWYDMIDKGLTTFAEKPDPTRSDCHAWSASPNYDLLATVCGIRPLTPGFKTVEIAPSLGKLNEIEGKLYMPKYDDFIEVSLIKQGETGLKGEVILPANLEGMFKWRDKVIILKGGKQKIVL